MRFTDSDGHRITGFLTDTSDGVVPGQLPGLELRHRQHARVEDRIRQAKATGLRNLPFNAFDANSAWLEIIMAAIDLIAWTKTIDFTDHPELARCEIATFRYRVLHVAARITWAALDKPGCVSTPPGAGHTLSPRPGPKSAPPSVDPRPPDPTDERPTRPWKAHPRATPGEQSHPTCHNRLTDPPTAGSAHPGQTPRKIEAGVVGPVGAAVKHRADRKPGPRPAGGREARKERSRKAAEQPRDGDASRVTTENHPLATATVVLTSTICGAFS